MLGTIMTFYSLSFRSLLLSLMLFSSVVGKYRWSSQEWAEAYHVAKSAAFFHASLLYNKIRFGKAFSFDEITGGCGYQKNPKICVCLSEEGKIVAIQDGKKSRLFLGAIPRYKEHIREIRERANLLEKDPIAFYTLNRPFERRWAGLDQLEKTESIISHKYPTTDFTAPLFEDVIRGVRDLEKEANAVKVRYVHCKAGRGRSAMMAAAYLMHICKKAGIDVTPLQVEDYLKSKRERISMNPEQKELLARFEKELKEVGNFNALYAKYKAAVEKRDKEVAHS